MIRYLFIFIALVHGLIHLMGFFKAFGLARLDELKLDISRPAGLFWLTAALLFGLAALLLAMQRDNWFMWAVPAVLLSQTLIILAWSDARFGTVANVIILAAVILAWGSWRFRRAAEEEVRELIPPAELSAGSTRHNPRFDSLPSPVRRWLNFSGAADHPEIQRVHLRQTGLMRTSPEGKWMPVEAGQWFNTSDPAFVWLARVKVAPGLYLAGRDKFNQGMGHMLIRLLSLFTVVDSRGPEIDQGTMLRYMGEMVWWPTAAVQDYFTWEGIDENSARLSMSYGGVQATGTFTFDADGRVLRFEALRYYNTADGASLEPWVVEVDPAHYHNFDGILVPARSAVSWKLAGGDFNWFNLEIVGIEYDRN